MSDCLACRGTGWDKHPYPHPYATKPCRECNGSGSDCPAETDYNKLVPPENPAYPWVSQGWQPLCYYCCEPIRMTQPEARYRQRVGFSWEHVNSSETGNQHIKGSHWYCDPAKVRANIERHEAQAARLAQPRCHICGTQTTGHAGICSAGGKPPYHATTMDRKEEELRKLFSWHPEQQKLGPKITKPAVWGMLAIIALATLAGTLKIGDDESEKDAND